MILGHYSAPVSSFVVLESVIKPSRLTSIQDNAKEGTFSALSSVCLVCSLASSHTVPVSALVICLADYVDVRAKIYWESLYTRSGLTFDMRWRCSKPLWKEARRESQWTCEAGGLEERKHPDKGTPLRSTLVRAQPLAVGSGVYLQECGDPPSLRFASPIFQLPSVGLSQDS